MKPPAPEPMVVYEAPPGGQPIRPADPAPAWERVAVFLRSCTDADPDRPQQDVKLKLYEPAAGDPVGWYEPARRAAEARFGPGKRQSWMHEVRTDFSVKSRAYCVEWRLAPERVGDARTFLTEFAPWPRATHEPVSLSLYFCFRWIDPVTRAVLPGQTPEARAHPTQAESTLHLWVGRRSSASLDARFPFPSADEAFTAYLGHVASVSPVTLLPSRFRLWVPTKKPSELGYMRRKVFVQVPDPSGR